jgi:carboxymethylenebutenolidase
LKELFGGLPEPFTNAAGNLPPVLILHGAQDTTVPVEQAYRLVSILQRHKISYQIRIYPDQGHVFKGLAQLDAMGRVAQCFMAYLLKAA